MQGRLALQFIQLEQARSELVSCQAAARVSSQLNEGLKSELQTCGAELDECKGKYTLLQDALEALHDRAAVDVEVQTMPVAESCQLQNADQQMPTCTPLHRERALSGPVDCSEGQQAASVTDSVRPEKAGSTTKPSSEGTQQTDTNLRKEGCSSGHSSAEDSRQLHKDVAMLQARLAVAHHRDKVWQHERRRLFKSRQVCSIVAFLLRCLPTTK